jgi:hypothetical protein
LLTNINVPDVTSMNEYKGSSGQNFVQEAKVDKEIEIVSEYDANNHFTVSAQ